MPTHHDETLLERYQREHRVYEGMKMSKAEKPSIFNRADPLLEKLLDHDLQFAQQTGAAQIVDDLMDTVRRLSAINAELLVALKAIVADRDENANGPEKYVPKSAGNNVSYWSPSATMVHSEFIAAARAAISKAQGEQP